MVEESEKTEQVDKAEKTRASTIWFRHLPPWVSMIFIAPGAILIITLIIPVHPMSRELARQAICKTRLKGIGTTVELYKADNRNADPVNWEELIEDQRIPAKLLICPENKNVFAADVTREELMRCADYILVSGFGQKGQDHLLRSFELPINHRQQVVNMLHMNGAVFGMRDLSEFMLQLQQTNDQLAELRKGRK